MPKGVKGKAVRDGYGPAAVNGTKAAITTAVRVGRCGE